MSTNYCITSTKEWIDNNCHELLDKYKKFLRFTDEDGYVYGRFDCQFLDYKSENIGVKWIHNDY
jgi:hypothetical protein